MYHTNQFCICVPPIVSKFVLVNVNTLQEIQFVDLNLSDFNINGLSFNPFFHLNDDQLHQLINEKYNDYPNDVKNKLLRSRQHIYIVGGVDATKTAFGQEKYFDIFI